MKRLIRQSQTFYITDLEDLWDSIATLPGFSIEEASDIVENEFKNCIPMTADERRKFLNQLKNTSAEESDYMNIYNSMKNTFMYEKFLNGEIIKTSYSFWITNAYDTHSTVFAVGADIVGNYEFDLNRIAKK